MDEQAEINEYVGSYVLALARANERNWRLILAFGAGVLNPIFQIRNQNSELSILCSLKRPFPRMLPVIKEAK
jgi:hypothetical protein